MNWAVAPIDLTRDSQSRFVQAKKINKKIYIYLFYLNNTLLCSMQGTREAIILCNGACEKRSNQQQ